MHLWASSRAEQTGQKLEGFSLFSCVRLDSGRGSGVACSGLFCRNRTRDTYSIEAGEGGSYVRLAIGEKLATRGPVETSSVLGGFRPPGSMAQGIYKLGLVVALGLGVVISASGQGRGFSAPMRGFSAPARISGPSRGISAPARANGFRRGVPPLVGTPLNPNFAPINGVPGLGFDFPHLAAISRPSHRFGHNRGFNSFFTPILFDSLPLYYPFDTGFDTGTPDYYAEGAQQPQYIMVQPQPQLQPITPPPAEIAPRATEPQTPAPPPPELGQLILVRRDGQVLLAVAFTANRGQLTYITREGTRRSFPVSELDKDATRQMNDANGTSVSLPE